MTMLVSPYKLWTASQWTGRSYVPALARRSIAGSTWRVRSATGRTVTSCTSLQTTMRPADLWVVTPQEVGVVRRPPRAVAEAATTAVVRATPWPATRRRPMRVGGGIAREPTRPRGAAARLGSRATAVPAAATERSQLLWLRLPRRLHHAAPPQAWLHHRRRLPVVAPQLPQSARARRRRSSARKLPVRRPLGRLRHPRPRLLPVRQKGAASRPSVHRLPKLQTHLPRRRSVVPRRPLPHRQRAAMRQRLRPGLGRPRRCSHPPAPHRAKPLAASRQQRATRAPPPPNRRIRRLWKRWWAWSPRWSLTWTGSRERRQRPRAGRRVPTAVLAALARRQMARRASGRRQVSFARRGLRPRADQLDHHP